MQDPLRAGPAAPVTLRKRLETLGLTADGAEWLDRYLVCEHLIDPRLASPRRRFEALAHFVRDLLADRWVKTRRAREDANPKRIYYLSMEFLIGRTLDNNILNLGADPLVQSVLATQGWALEDLLPSRSRTRGSATAGSAGWRPASSTRSPRSSIGHRLRPALRVRHLPAVDPGRYQVEEPDNWLSQPDPWEIQRGRASATT